MSAWLLLAAGEDRQHGGNEGYDDEPDVHYSWDSTVPNHAALQVGDHVVLWDKRRLLGVSVIEDIGVGSEEKLLHRCPECELAGIKARKRKAPRYKCYKCGAEFDNPVSRIEVVKTYRSRHDAGWMDLEDALGGDELRTLSVSPKSQLSLRPLRWGAFQAAIRDRLGEDAVKQVNRRSLSEESVGSGGHVQATVRVRLGQTTFRKRLLESQGPRCAFTGDAPPAVLEAGHLYSYADLGVHMRHGGLLLRRDIHRLFDDGALSVDPDTMKVDVGSALRPFEQYRSLDGRPLAVALEPTQITWLKRHWTQHR